MKHFKSSVGCSRCDAGVLVWIANGKDARRVFEFGASLSSSSSSSMAGIVVARRGIRGSLRGGEPSG